MRLLQAEYLNVPFQGESQPLLAWTIEKGDSMLKVQRVSIAKEAVQQE